MLALGQRDDDRGITIQERKLLKINEKEIVDSKTFTMELGEVATLTLKEIPGASVIFKTIEVAEPNVSHLSTEIKGNDVTFTLPFIKEGNASVNLTLADMPGGTVTGRLAYHSLGRVILLHLDVYLERNVNYGQRR